MIVPRDFVSVAAGPDDVRIGEIGERETGLAAAEPVIPCRRAPESTAATSTTGGVGARRVAAREVAARAGISPAASRDARRTRVTSNRRSSAAGADARRPRVPSNRSPSSAAATTPPGGCIGAPTPPATTTAPRARGDAARGSRRLRSGARPTHRPVVLTIAVDPIGYLIVRRDVIHLRDRQHDGLECLPVIVGQSRAEVVREAEMITPLWVDPSIGIAAGT